MTRHGAVAGVFACAATLAIAGCGGTKTVVRTRTVTATAAAAATQTPSPARPRPHIALPPLTSYTASSYSAKLPDGWDLAQDDEAQGGSRYVTKAVSPNGHLSVVIDTTLDTSGDPATSAATLEPGLKSSGGYQRIVYRPTTVGSDDAFEWAYRQNGDVKVDLLFFRAPNGYGVLTEGPSSALRTLRALARRVGKSITPKSEPPPPAPTDTQPSSGCDPNYKGACLDPNSADYDCEGGSGDGPDYVQGPIEVVGDDHFDLDRDGDGIACE